MHTCKNCHERASREGSLAKATRAAPSRLVSLETTNNHTPPLSWRKLPAMPYNSDLAQRLSQFMIGRSEFEPRKMFGGICFMLEGNICFGIWRDYLILRVGEPSSGKLIRQRLAKPMDITGRPMKGWVMVPESEWSNDKKLKEFCQMAASFVRTLPPK